MSPAKFSIGIDLGTTNCAMAFVPLDEEASQSEMFPVPQWESLAALSESLTLPSFLYLPSEGEAAQMLGREFSGREWISGRFARKKASESPDRVAHSAKSWLCHHAVDRSAPFLPWRSRPNPHRKENLPDPGVRAPARIPARSLGRTVSLGRDRLFSIRKSPLPFPHHFDAAAQRLTLDAASQAGFPDNVRLLEEPQAAFYRWLEQHSSPDALKLPKPELVTSSSSTSAAELPISVSLRSAASPEHPFPISSVSPSAITCCSEATTSILRLRTTSSRASQVKRFLPLSGTFWSRDVAI